MSLKAQEYQKIRRYLTLFSLLYTPILLLALALSGWSISWREWAISVSSVKSIQIGVYFTLFSLFFLILNFPISFYSGYLLEKKYDLSNESISSWGIDFVKKSLLSFALFFVLVEMLYFLIFRFPENWWLWVWGSFFLVSFILGKIFPVFIVPIFYKYKKIENIGLVEKINGLLEKHGLPAANLFSLNLSKTTKKVNAAFMGLGKQKRVVLSDTLLESFNDDEILNVVAHELGHYKHLDIWKQMVFSSLVSCIVFFAAFVSIYFVSDLFGLSGASDLAAMPLLFLILYIAQFVLSPAQNFFSRVCERAADLFALQECRQPNVFISTMKKLAEINLADPSPPFWYEFLFYSHPATQKRIEMAKSFRGNL